MLNKWHKTFFVSAFPAKCVAFLGQIFGWTTTIGEHHQSRFHMEDLREMRCNLSYGSSATELCRICTRPPPQSYTTEHAQWSSWHCNRCRCWAYPAGNGCIVAGHCPSTHPPTGQYHSTNWGKLKSHVPEAQLHLTHLATEDLFRLQRSRKIYSFWSWSLWAAKPALAVHIKCVPRSNQAVVSTTDNVRWQVATREALWTHWVVSVILWVRRWQLFPLISSKETPRRVGRNW
jgi:hypothetical protein